MTDITFRSDMGVDLISSHASDKFVTNAARISTSMHFDQDGYSQERKVGLINYLMKNRHGTPFEHNLFTFRIECPIFVAREFMRHRIASYNEESGRYTQLKGVFWVPNPARPLVQEGKPGHYVFKPGTKEQYDAVLESLERVARVTYGEYEMLLDMGIAKEVARGCLTVSTYTSFYVTMNARGLMNFLSLRVDDPDATYPSKPQYEIEQVAMEMEARFAQKMPITHQAFVDHGRVAP